MVAVSDGIYAGAPFHNTSTAHPMMIRTEGVPATDATETTVEEVKERPWTISVPVWIPGYAGRFTVGGVEVGGEPDGDFWDRLWQDPSWESPFIFKPITLGSLHEYESTN
jgi:hypothetical protein